MVHASNRLIEEGTAIVAMTREGAVATPVGADRARLRVAVCLSYFPPIIGGAEWQVFQLCREWVARGHSATVFTRAVNNAPRTEVVDGVEARRVLRPIPLGPLFGASFVAGLVARLIRHRGAFDVVFAGQAPWEAIATGIARLLITTPSVVCLQNTGPFGDLAQLRRAKGARVLRSLFRRNDHFVSLSEHGRVELESLGVPSDRITVIPSGVDPHRFAPPSNPSADRDRTALFVGRLAEQKNPLALIDAWKVVNRDGRYRLCIAGRGELEGAIRERIERESVRGVEMLGFQSDVAPLYQRASVLALPSISEGCCNALLEAMASGMCPVATRIGGNVDVVNDGQTGILVSPSDPRDLARGLSVALEDTKERHRLSEAARRWVVERHDIRAIADRYLETFARLRAEQSR
jgi:glycosyltransferase involved in cell wall biosynthesis